MLNDQKLFKLLESIGIQDAIRRKITLYQKLNTIKIKHDKDKDKDKDKDEDKKSLLKEDNID